MEIKITKKRIIADYNSTAYSDGFKAYQVYGKIINDDNTRYRPFAFVKWIWKDDLFEYDDYPEYMSDKRQKEITNEFIWSFIDCNYPKSYEDCKDFYQECRKSCKEYNDWYYKNN